MLPKPTAKPKRRRDDSQWRAEVIALRGAWCRACGGPPHPSDPPDRRTLEANHVIPRGQGGESVVENGMVLCRWHHRLVTDSGPMLWSWLDDDQVEWLEAEGHAWLEVHGRHCPRFAVG